MLKHRVAFATLAVALAACGSEDERTPVPGATLDNPVEYFGVEPCTCYEYMPEGGVGPRLGVVVDMVSNKVLDNPDGAEEYVMRYRINGLQERLYVFRPTNPNLLLRQIRIGDTTGPTYEIEPFLPWLRFPAKQGKVEVEDANVVDLQSGEEPTKVNFRADYLPETVEASLDGGTTTESFDAMRISYQGLPFREDFRWFVPNVGLVRIELQTAAGRTEYILDRKYDLGGNCPVPDFSVAPSEICGVTN